MSHLLILAAVVLLVLSCRTRKGRRRAWHAVAWAGSLLVWLVVPARRRRGLYRRRGPATLDRPGQGPRFFTREQKAVLLARAGYRCQRVTFGIRCRATERLCADHRHPYSWGGKTILQNGWILCWHHNEEKGARFTDVTDRAELAVVCVQRRRRRVRLAA